MIITELYHGQGFGNQLFAYVTTRMLAHNLGYGFGISGRENLGDRRFNTEGVHFMDLDLGCEVIGGSSPPGGPPTELPESIKHHYFEYRHGNHTDLRLKTDIRLTDKFGISIHGGYHRSIGGTFEAYTAGFSLKYYNLSGGTTNPFSNEKITKIKTQGIQISAQNQTYFDVAKFGIPNSDLNLIAIKLNYDLNHRYYLAGEASFAYEGESGGYAQGTFGIGIKSNKFLNEKFSTFLELSGGVAGGGRVDSGEGILV